MEIWRVPIMDGPVPLAASVIAGAFVAVLLVRRWRPRSLRGALIGGFAGAIVAAGACLIANATNTFGDALPPFVLWYSVAALGASGFALGGLIGARLWRKIVSVLAIPAFLIVAVLGINTAFGLNPTLGTLFGRADAPAVALPPDPPGNDPAPAQPLYLSWSPPADMPAVGSRGSAVIPATASGFAARDAGVYLPPAALVPNAPALPLIIMMMGFPGNPDPTIISDVADSFAAQHEGLAPIIVVADQIGSSGSDPACADSTAYGKARTYLTVDVVDWARKNLKVIDNPAYWTIAGYSNGGGCAITYGAAYPQLWKNIIDVSGEQFPGSEHVDDVVQKIYGDSVAAFEASKPINIMKAAPAGTYQGMTAVFTAGDQDPTFSAAADAVSAAARDAGMTVTRSELAGQGHTGPVVNPSLSEAFSVLYPVLGLAPPA